MADLTDLDTVDLTQMYECGDLDPDRFERLVARRLARLEAARQAALERPSFLPSPRVVVKASRLKVHH